MDFYWIQRGVIAGSKFPDYSMFKRYEEEGIIHVINLTKYEYDELEINQFQLHSLPITDFGIPDETTVQRYLEITDNARKKKQPVVVHCYAGCGRTGTMLALWLIKYQGLGADKAIQTVRHVRPCALENLTQVNFVKRFSVDARFHTE